MTHWMHTETPFGNVVYTFHPQESQYGGPDTVELYAHGAGSLSEDDALRVDHEGDTVPDWDALKGEARRLADAAGAPLPAWYTPNPSLVVNGKGYASSLTLTYYSRDAAELGRGREHYAGRVFVKLDGVTDAARRKLEEWFTMHRAGLIEGERALIVAANRAQDAARRADRTAEETRTALALATENARAAATASRAAADALHTFRILARVDKLAETTTTAVNQIGA